MPPEPIMQSAFNRMKRCRHGFVLYNLHDQYIGKSFDRYGEYSEGEIELFGQILKPNDIVIDVGANIGAHTLYFAQATMPDGIVIAFEPQRLIYQTLCANMAINSITNAICHRLAVGETRGELRVPSLIPTVENNFGGLSLRDPTGGEPVEVIMLDNVAVPRCTLIKIDVEGMELPVLRGGENFIRKHMPIFYLENHGENSDAIIRYIDSLGYNMYWHIVLLFQEKNFFNEPENIFGNTASHNMACFPKGVNVEGMRPVKVPTTLRPHTDRPWEE
jgi:FkbM family methyltransferase